MYIQLKQPTPAFESEMRERGLEALTHSDLIRMEQNLSIIAMGLKDIAQRTKAHYLPISYGMKGPNQVEVHADLATIRRFCTEGRLMMHVKYRGPNQEQYPWMIWCILPTIQPVIPGVSDISIKMYCVADMEELERAGIHIHLDTLEEQALNAGVSIAPEGEADSKAAVTAGGSADA